MNISGDSGSRRGGAMDHISGLPDNLLHSILLHLPCTAEAARTTVLARRWRHVWANLPELSLCFRAGTVAQPQDRVDAALAACSAPTVKRLVITMPFTSPRLPPHRITSWLRFASQRVAGELQLQLNNTFATTAEEKEVVVLPLCERVTSIDIALSDHKLQFQLPPDGVFSALATMRMTKVLVDSHELEGILSSRCPHLKELALESIVFQEGALVLSIRSDSLERLEIRLPKMHLQLVAPELQAFSLGLFLSDFHIVAPKLSEVYWNNHYSVYDPSRHRFAEAGRHLRRLVVDATSSVLPLMHRFDTINELDLTVHVRQGVEEYERFLVDTNMLSKCEVLVVRFQEMKHAFKPAILHLLRKCTGIRKLVVYSNYEMDDDYPCKSLSGCPCGWLVNRRTNSIVLDSLEEVEIKGDGRADHKIELVRLFCKFSMTSQKEVVIIVSEHDQSHRKKIQSFHPPSNNAKIIVRST
ncbi:hypothetical protein ACP70R_005665 [Stipagrostis hirtigluma subsp. patula]